jgi:cytochrome P450/NADPH-cytochrome P450 reductase
LNAAASEPAPSGRPEPLQKLPSLPNLPVLASLPWLYHRDGFVPRLVEIAEAHRDVGAFRVPMPDGRTPLFVGNAALAEDLVDEARFEKVLDGPLLHIRDFAGDGLFTAHADEPSWQVANRVLSPGFSTPSIERYFPAMKSSLEAMLGTWRSATTPVDVLADMTKLTLDTISLAGFDYAFDSFSRPELHPFLQSLARALQESIDVLRRPPLFAPLYRKTRARYAADIAAMFALVDEVIRERKRKPPEAWPKDFLSLMLENADPKTGERLTDENIRYQILTFLIAGHETTASLLAFTFHAVARDRDLFARLRKEVDDVLGEGEPTMKQVLALDLTRRTLSEGLRLWPTVPIVTRAAKEATTLGGRWAVPKGQMFGLLLQAVHRDPAVWSEPARFDPDRFLPEATKARPSWAYKPFGIGRRSCTGKHFALIEATLCLALVVREFDVDDPGPLSLSPTLVPKPKAFRLRLRRRRSLGEPEHLGHERDAELVGLGLVAAVAEQAPHLWSELDHARVLGADAVGQTDEVAGE